MKASEVVLLVMLFLLLVFILASISYYNYRDNLLLQECVKAGGIFINTSNIKGCFQSMVK